MHPPQSSPADPSRSDARKPQGGRRRRQPVPRPHRIKFLVDDQELADIDAAARRHGMSLGAYAAVATVARARRKTDAATGSADALRDLNEATAAVVEQWRLLRTVGGLLNQLARIANSTGELHEKTDRVLRVVEGATQRADGVMGELRALVRDYPVGRRPPSRKTSS